MPYQNGDLKFTMFLSHCFTGVVYIKTVVNIVKIGNTDTVSMTVCGKFYVISPLCGVQRGEVFQASELTFVEDKKNTQIQVANCATPKLPASFPNS